MFWISSITVMLCYCAQFTICKYISARSKDRASMINFLFQTIEAISSYVTFLFTILYISGLVSFQIFLDFQSWIVGYFFYHFIVKYLHPEIVIKSDTAVSINMLVGSYIYSYGSYSQIYGIAGLLCVSRLDDWIKSNLAFDISKSAPWSKFLNAFEIGLLSALLVFSILTLDFIPACFFGELIWVYMESFQN